MSGRGKEERARVRVARGVGAGGVELVKHRRGGRARDEEQCLACTHVEAAQVAQAAQAGERHTLVRKRVHQSDSAAVGGHDDNTT